jgi:glycosyltransferase involved in cell wall biosynthesis
MNSPPALTLVYLCYNEQENIAAALDEGLAYCNADLTDWEIVVVDDGSSDRSVAIVNEYVEREPRIRLVQHPKNKGMGGAMATGIAHATKPAFVFLPSDLQVEAAELRKMVPLLNGAEIILTVYARRPSSVFRAIMSRTFRDFLMVSANIHFQLEGLYLFPTELGKELLSQVKGDTFFFSFQLVQLAIERGVRTASTTIVCKPRLAGASKVANPKRIRQVVTEVFAYRARRGLE